MQAGPLKIKTHAQLSQIAEKFRDRGKIIVLAHGVFDLIHWGHIHYLREAKKYGDVLVVSLVNDKFIYKTEVVKRPLMFAEKTRIAWLAELETVDFVSFSNAPGPYKLIRVLKPDFFAKGSDSRSRLKDKKSGLWQDKREIEKLGGKLVFTKSLPIHSSDILKSNES